MLWFTLVSVVSAAELRFQTCEAVVVQLNGDVLAFAEGADAVTAQGLPAGEHVLKVLDTRGTLLAERRVKMGGSDKRRFGFIDGLLVDTRPPAKPKPKPSEPMTESQLAGILAQMKEASFASDKLEILRAAATKYHARVDQLKRMVELLSHSTDQVSAVRIWAPRVLDKDKAETLTDAFSFHSDRKKVLELLQP